MQYENLTIHSSSYKNSTTKIAHCNTFHFSRYAHFRLAKCLFTNIEYQVAYFLEKLQIKRAKYSRTVKIQKVTGHYFCMNTNIQRDFQIYISVPLIRSADGILVVKSSCFIYTFNIRPAYLQYDLDILGILTDSFSICRSN